MPDLVRVSEIKGLKELSKALALLPDAVAAQSLARSVHAGAEVIKINAEGRIRRRTGMLARRLQNRLLELDRFHAKYAVLDSAPHAHLVEFGHRQVEGGPLGKGGHQVGFVPPHPFLRPAFDENVDLAMMVFREQLGANIDRAWDQLQVDQSAPPEGAGEA